MKLHERLSRSGALRRRSAVNPSDFFGFTGGLNVVDPPLTIAPGQLIGVKNYEPGVRGGYARTEGYERFSGLDSPTDTPHYALTVQGVTGNPFIVDNLAMQFPTGTSTTATATGRIVLAQATGVANEWYVVVTSANVDFTLGADLRVGVSSPGALAGAIVLAAKNDAANDVLNETFISAKVEFLRAKIEAVGGAASSGPVRGCAIYKTDVVAFRDNAAATAADMWKATSTGWVKVPLGFKIRFNTGVVEIAEGEVINGLTSGATAIARRIVSDDGMWTIGDASGYLVTDAITGTFTPGEVLRVGVTAVAVFVSSAAQTLPPGGRYRFRVHNFFGSLDRRRLYGVNEIGRALEWDGTTFVVIETGMVDDRPTRIFVLNDHLGLCYRGGSVQNSGFQKPLNYNPILGADERGVGSDVTDVIEESFRQVVIGTRFQTYIFSGDVVENFQLRMFSVETGIISDTAAKLGQTMYLDDRGFTALTLVSQAGNFQANSTSDKILPFVQKQIKTPVVGSVVNRERNMYRCLFSDGVMLSVVSRPGFKIEGWTVSSFPDTPFSLFSGEIDTGQIFAERSFMCGVNGFLYELDKGRSFDGKTIEAFLKLAYHHSKSPERVKHYRKATIDLAVAGPTSFFVSADYNYGRRGASFINNLDLDAGGGLWDISTWDKFKWSAPTVDQILFDLDGSGFNVSLFFYSNSTTSASHTLYNAAIHNSVRRIQRGNQPG